MALLRLAVPGGVLVAIAYAVERWGHGLDLGSVSPLWPPALFAASLILTAWFHHRRLMLAALGLALAERGLTLFGAAERAGPGIEWLLPAVALLLPLNILGTSLARERGRLTLPSLGAVAAIGMQPLVVADLALSAPQAVPAVLREPLVLGNLPPSPLPTAASIAFGLALPALGFQALRRRSPSDRGLLWALVAAGLAVVRYPDPGPQTLYFCLAAAILLLALLESSYSLAYRDELTGLPARRALNDALPGLDEPYTIAIVDVDHFKRFNDRHGHKVGDQVLARIASSLTRAPGGGRGFRYGGEEFVLLYPGQKLADVLPHLETLRQEIADTGFTLRAPDRPRRKPQGNRVRRISGKKVALTVSIGAAQPTPKRPGPQAVLQAADKALYRAKRGGRNRVSK